MDFQLTYCHNLSEKNKEKCHKLQIYQNRGYPQNSGDLSPLCDRDAACKGILIAFYST